MSAGNDVYENFQNQVKAINFSLIALDKSFIELCDLEDSLTKVADSLVDIHSLKAEFSIVYDSACSKMIDKMGTVPEVTSSSGNLVEKKSGADRKKWDHDKLAKNVASRINDMAINLETGEVQMTPQDMMAKMFDFAAVSYWRVKELGKIGISADSFCEVSEAKTSIIVRKAK